MSGDETTDYSCVVRNSSGSELCSSYVNGEEKRHLHVLHDGTGGKACCCGGRKRGKDGEGTSEHTNGEVEEEGGNAQNVDGH